MILGNHFCVGIPHPELDPATRHLLREIRPACVILFRRNVCSASQLARLASQLRNLLGPNLLVCIDLEGGRVNRLSSLTGAIPSAVQLGFLGRENLASEHGRLIGRLLREIGVNVNLAPVLDLWLRPKTDNSVPDRCWSRDPRGVIRLAGAFLRAMQQEGVAGCGKHFLSGGSANKDPHLLLPCINRRPEQILKVDLAPYAGLVPPASNGECRFHSGHLHFIMISHVHFRVYHGNRLTPASISPVIAGTVLREILGFRGLAITDDLEMGAITRTMKLADATVRCLRQGVDLALICHTAKAMREGYRAAQKALDKGLLPMRTLVDSEKQILRLQEHFKTSTRFSQRRFDAAVRDIRRFTKKIFSAIPPRLRVIDERWGPIGEKN